MRIENDGLLLTVEVPSSPLAGVELEIRLALAPAAPDARILIDLSVNGGRAQQPVVRRVSPDAGDFMFELPGFDAGAEVAVGIAGLSNGKRVPAEGDDDSARFVLAVPAGLVLPEQSAAAPPVRALLPAGDVLAAEVLVQRLVERGIVTGGDLLAAGAAAFSGLTLAESETLRTMTAHAALESVTDDPTVRRALIAAGLLTPSALAAQSPAALRENLGSEIEPERVEAIHRVASAQVAFLNHVAAADGRVLHAALPEGGPGGRCGCEDCEAATSPLAFLVDLVNYITTTVRLGPAGGNGPATPFDLARLTSLLQQPLADLVATCAAVDEPVREVRLTTETLRRHLRASGPPDADVTCSPLPLPLEFLITGDVDGDRRDELVVGFRADAGSLLQLPAGVEGGFWVMDFDPLTRSWSHLQPMPGGAGADVLLAPGLRVKYACCADVDGDGRAEVVLAVGNVDGTPDPSLGAIWFWVMRHDPASGWAHTNPAVFDANRAAFNLGDPSAQVLGLLAGDVDGDGADEVILATTSATRPNAFWVFDLVPTANGLLWQPLSPGLDFTLPAFECAPTGQPGGTFAPRLARVADVDANRRAEVIAFPDAPGSLGAAAWVMAYDPPPPGGEPVGTWRHVNGTNPGPAGTDVPPPWSWDERAAHASVSQDRSERARVVLTSERTPGSAAPGDPDRFHVVGYGPAATPDPWVIAAQVDADAGDTRFSAVLAADVDDDGRDELIGVGEVAGRRAAWVMHHRPDGTWEHLSPIAGHPLGADLEWSTAEHQLAGIVAADVDQPRSAANLDLRRELIFYGRSCNEIWVMSYDPAASTWRHLSQVTPADLESGYLLTAYQSLLAELGTSLEELRAARGADPAERQALADRLGIPLRPVSTLPETLDQLLLGPGELSEARLEEQFGLADTTRNPLSSALVNGDSRRQVRSISLTGVVWSANPRIANVGADGDLLLDIARVNPPSVSVTLQRPDGAVVARGEGEPVARIRLTPAYGSGLSGWIDLDYRQNVTSIRVSALPKLTAWRLQYLRAVWDEQDAPSGRFAPGPLSAEPALPAIDPDVIGPDDFRVPYPKAQPTDPDGPFDLWIQRRRWVDDRLADLEAVQPDLDAMLATLRPAVGTALALAEDFPWEGAPAAASFGALAEVLTRGTPTEAQAARTTVETALWLPVDAFLRLIALSARVRDTAAPATAAEWSEIRSILVLARKRRRVQRWQEEEATAQVTVGPAAFWAAARAPTEGEWPPPAPADGVWIDPETVALADLPQGGAGMLARGLLQARRREVEGDARTIRSARPAGLEAMMVAALGPPAGGTTWRQRVSMLVLELQSSDLATAAAARAALASELGLEVGPFRRLAAIEAALRGGGTATETEWMDVEAVLTSARKRKLMHPAWAGEETALAALLTPWRARRAALPRWRALEDDRLAWEQELRRRSRAAVVDPDRFTPAWCRGFGEPTSRLYNDRRAWLLGETSRLRAARPAGGALLAQVDSVLRAGLFEPGERARLVAELARSRAAQDASAVLEQVFGAAAAGLQALRADLASTDQATVRGATRRAAEEFWLDAVALQQVADTAAAPAGGVSAAGWDRFDRALADAALTGRMVAAEEAARAAGVRMRSLLDQLGVTSAARAQLLRTRAVATAGGPILDGEWDAVIAIALRAVKFRRAGEWLLAELGSTPGQRVRLGPDSFTMPPGPDLAADEGQPRAWLTAPDEVRWWQDTLESRIDLERTVIAGVRNAVSRAEELALPILRDRLLQALSPPGADGAAWAQDHYLIDARAGACVMTTRAARAIDTLLALLWSLRTGQLRDTYPQLDLRAPTFDTDWRWLGSYASWRSAVLVRLYPENILRPNLRRQRTPVFDDLLGELRGGRQLTQQRARQLAGSYAEYFRDVCSLELAGMVCARVEQWTRSGEEGATPGAYDFLFATSQASGKLYWSTLALPGTAADPGFEQSFWRELPGFGAAIAGVVGATTYRPSPPTPRVMSPAWVYVFVLTRDLERQGISFVRYNLLTRSWETAKDLEPPRDAPAFSARIVAGPATSPPTIGFETTRPDATGSPLRVHFMGTMNAKGTAWNSQGVVELAQWRWTAVNGQVDRTPRDLLALDADADGIVELAVVPAGAGPIEFYAGHATNAVTPRIGQTSRSIEDGSMVCVGDFNNDRRMEVAWTLAPRASNLARSTAVLIERRDATSGQWVADGPDAASPDGASAGATNYSIGSQFLVAADIDQVNQDEILIAIPARFDFILRPNGSRIHTGTWGAFWAITRYGSRYRRNVFGSYVPDPDFRTPFDNEVLESAFACSPPETAAAALAVAGDFDGDRYDELVVFLSPMTNASGAESFSMGNDFWALDQRRDRRLRTLGPVVNARLNTVGDMSAEPTVVAAAFAADIDGDGRDELIAIPYVADPARGSSVWAWEFRPGGAADPAEGGYWAALPNLDLSRDLTAVTHVVAADLDGDGAQELVLFGTGRSWACKYVPALGSWQPLPDPLPTGTTVAAVAAGRFLRGRVDQVIVAFGTVTPEQITESLPYNERGDQAIRSRYVRTPNSAEVRLLTLAGPPELPSQPQCSHSGIAPAYAGAGTDWVLDDRADIDERRARTRQAFAENAGVPASLMTYLWEAFYAVPIAVALALQRAGDHTHALDWFRLVYDYTRAPEQRKTFYGLVLNEQSAGGGFGAPVLEWLSDPLDVNAIAATRPHTFTRGAVQLIVSCLLDAADAEFTIDTAESIERARLLYGGALELLALPILNQRYEGCTDVIGRFAAQLEDTGAQALVRPARRDPGRRARRTHVRILARRDSPGAVRRRGTRPGGGGRPGRCGRVPVRGAAAADAGRDGRHRGDDARARARRADPCAGHGRCPAGGPGSCSCAGNGNQAAVGRRDRR